MKGFLAVSIKNTADSTQVSANLEVSTKDEEALSSKDRDDDQWTTSTSVKAQKSRVLMVSFLLKLFLRHVLSCPFVGLLYALLYALLDALEIEAKCLRDHNALASWAANKLIHPMRLASGRD